MSHVMRSVADEPWFVLNWLSRKDSQPLGMKPNSTRRGMRSGKPPTEPENDGAPACDRRILILDLTTAT